jgi:RNA polymerase sigma-70 factor (ECF subfamily)
MRGDLSAFETLMRLHASTVIRLARSLVGDEHQAEDVAQQAWLRIHQNLGQFDPAKGSFSAWALRITRNLSLNALRAGGRSPIRILTSVPEPACDADPSHQAVLREQFALLDDALAKLPAEQRSAWSLSELEGLSQAEIAMIEGIPEGTVKSRVSRAKQSLRNLLTIHDQRER